MITKNHHVRFVAALSVLFVWNLLCHPRHSFADETETALVSVFKFAGGVISAFMIHEGAHFAAGHITGTDLDWKVGTFNQPIEFSEKAKDDSDGVAVYSAGLVAQVVSSEIILNVDTINKNDAFIRGMMAWNIINPIMYALDYWFIHNTNNKNGDSYQGDLNGIEHYSSERTANIFAGSMVALATFQGYRFLKTQSWAPEWIRDKTQNLQFAGTPDGGFFLGLKIDF
jgi:hypothetical protein